MFRLLFSFVSYSTRSIGGCLTGMCLCFAALIIVQWLIGAVVGAVSALPLPAIVALVVLAGGVLLLPPPWRAVVVVVAVVGVLAFHAAPATLLAVAVVVPAAWLGRRYGRLIRPRARGARWATFRELWREGFLTRPTARSLAQRWPMGRWHGLRLHLPAAREREGVLVVAQTGTGKTAGILVPAILAEANRPAGDRRSQLLIDPKDELAQLTLPTLATTHRTLVWDPSKPGECSVRYDPLALLPSPVDPGFIDELRFLADAWADTTREGDYSTDPIWKTMARHFMRGIMLAYLDRYPTTASFIGLGDWVRSLAYEDLLNCVAQATSRHVAAFEPTMRSVGLNDRMAGSIFSDLQHRFEVLDTPHIRAAMEPGQTIDWEEFVNTPTALYLKVPARDAHQLGALLSLFMAQAYRALTSIAARHPGNTLPRGVRILIDEFGNLPRVYQVENALATMRSYDIGHLLCLQSRSQLALVYGTKLAQSIQENLVTSVILGGAADEDARWFSNRCGQRTQYHRRATRSVGGFPFRGSGASFGYEPDTRPLIAPEELTHCTGWVYISTHGLPPVRCKLRPYFKDRRTVARLEADARQWALAHLGGPISTAGWPCPASVPSPVTPPPWSVPDLDDI